MINDETKRKLRAMKLGEMIDLLDMQDGDKNMLSLSFDERIQMVIDGLWQEKHAAKIKRLIKSARFRHDADMNDIIYEGRDIDKNAILDLSSCHFLANSTNVILQGFTGSGKTFLACALGRQACKRELRAMYVRMPELLDEYADCRLIPRGGRKLIRKFSTFDLLILDEWLMRDMGIEDRDFIFEIIEKRSERASTIFCTQYKRAEWHVRLGGGVSAGSIIDRVIHNAFLIEMARRT